MRSEAEHFRSIASNGQQNQKFKKKFENFLKSGQICRPNITPFPLSKLDQILKACR